MSQSSDKPISSGSTAAASGTGGRPDFCAFIYRPGDRIGERFRIITPLGAGGMGAVYLVEDSDRPGTPVALKLTGGKSEALRVEGFRREFSILAHLAHPNLIKVFDFGVLPKGEGYYYTAEHIEGRNLFDETENVEEEQLADYILQVCRALEYIHTRGYIHYDVKPGNVIVRRDGVVKLMDFGLTALASRGMQTTIKGTPAYTAPEIIACTEVDNRADLYSLGISIFEITARKRPYAGKTLERILRAHLSTPLPSIKAVAPKAPKFVVKTIEKLCAKNPRDRFHSANAVIEAISSLLGLPARLDLDVEAEAILRSAPFVGRQREMKVVRQVFEKLENTDSGSALVFEGPFGIGKSRLLGEIRFEAQLRGFAGGSASLKDFPETSALFDELLRQLRTNIGETGTLDAEPGSSHPPEDNGMPESVTRILDDAKHTRVVLVLDDVQDAPLVTRAVLDKFLTILAGENPPPVCIILMVEGKAEKILKRALPEIRHQIGPLSQAETSELAGRMFGLETAPELLTSQLLKRTGGYPLAIIETVRLLVERGETRVIGHKWRLSSAVDLEKIPEHLEEVYARQTESLRGPSRLIAYILALLDRGAAAKELLALAGKASGRLGAALADLERRGFIRWGKQGIYLAKPGMIKALESSRTQSTKKRWHGKIADTLAALSRKDKKIDLTEIAWHYLESGQDKKGIRFGMKAVRESGDRQRPPRAVPVLLKLAEILPEDDRRTRTEVYFELVKAVRPEIGPELLLKYAAEYRKVASRRDPPERRSLVETLVAKSYAALGREKECEAAWKTAFDLVREMPDFYINTVFHYIMRLEHRGRFAEGEKLLLDTLAKYGDKDDMATLHIYLALTRLASRRVQADLIGRYTDRIFEIARALKMNPEKRAGFIILQAIKLLHEHNYDEAEKQLILAKELSVKTGNAGSLAVANGDLACIYFRIGRVEEALNLFAETEAMFRNQVDFVSLAGLYAIMINETRNRIPWKLRQEYLKKGRQAASDAGSVLLEYRMLGGLADISAQRGDFRATIRYADEAKAHAEKNKIEKNPEILFNRAKALAFTTNAAAGMEHALKGLNEILPGENIDLIIPARLGVLEIALIAGEAKLALDQVAKLEILAPRASATHRLNIIAATVDMWTRLGLFGRAVACIDEFEELADRALIAYDRGRAALRMGQLAMGRMRFGSAREYLKKARLNLLPEIAPLDFIELLAAGTELSIRREDASAATDKLKELQKALSDLSVTSGYFKIVERYLVARFAFMLLNRSEAYRTAMSAVHGARNSGCRFLELELLLLAAATTEDESERRTLQRTAHNIANKTTEHLDHSVRADARTYLLRPIREGYAGIRTDEIPPPPKTIDKTVEMLEFVTGVLREPTPQRAVSAVLDAVFRFVPAMRGFLVVKDETGIRFVSSRGADPAELEKPNEQISFSIIEEAFQAEKPLFTENAKNDPRFDAAQSIVSLDLLSVAAIPFRIAGAIQGCIYVDNSRVPGAFTGSHRQALEQLAAIAATVLERQLHIREIKELNQSLLGQIEKQSAELELSRRQLNLSAEPPPREAFAGIIGKSAILMNAVENLRKVSNLPLPVLITGDSGTGKTFFAKRLHTASERSEKPLIIINCGSIPRALIEAEFFGVEQGAFTGAQTTRKGYLEQAEGGTLLLDEISDLSDKGQTALLRTLEERTIRRVGGQTQIPVDVRIVATSRHDLESLANEGQFRRDLLYRLNTIEIKLPLLRERTEDIPLLADFFMQEIAREAGRKIKPLSVDAMNALAAYDWPGNALELRNVLERAFHATGKKITPKDLELTKRGARKIVPVSPLRSPRLRDAEREHILRVLADNNGRIRKTARDLDIARDTLYKKLARYRKEGYLRD